MALTYAQKESRKRFAKKYSNLTVQIIRLVRMGWKIPRIVTKLGTTMPTVRTTLGNYTRGTYNRFIESAGL